MSASLSDVETLKQQFAVVPKELQPKPCEKTMSGKHMWRTEQLVIRSYPPTTEKFSRCLACGIINDLGKEKEE